MLIIDRFEEDFAVVEDSEKDANININKEFIEEGAKEGDVLALVDSSFYMIDHAATEKRREQVLALEKRIREKMEK